MHSLGFLRGFVMTTSQKRAALFSLVLIFLLPPVGSLAKPRKRAALKQSDIRAAQHRLGEMGFGGGQMALITFQKWDGLKVSGTLTRNDYEAIMNASAPQPRDDGYRHVEVDLDRQVLLLVDSDGAIKKILPVSTGSGKRYKEKGMRGLAYTPRGRFRIYNKLSGWKKSPLGLLYYPNYFSDGLAIHGNPSVPHIPQSHGCVRIPMSSAAEMSKRLPVGMIVLIYDSESFVSAKDWAEDDKRKEAMSVR
jgi:hypothetical protein